MPWRQDGGRCIFHPKRLLTITIRSYKGLGSQQDVRKKQELYIMTHVAGSGIWLFRTGALESKQTCLPVLALSFFFPGG